MGKHRRDLEAAHQAEACHLCRLHAGDVTVLEADRAAGRRQERGQQVEAGGLAGAVRTDQGMDRALPARSATHRPPRRSRRTRGSSARSPGWCCSPRTSPFHEVPVASLIAYRCRGRKIVGRQRGHSHAIAQPPVRPWRFRSEDDEGDRLGRRCGDPRSGGFRRRAGEADRAGHGARCRARASRARTDRAGQPARHAVVPGRPCRRGAGAPGGHRAAEVQRRR